MKQSKKWFIEIGVGYHNTLYKLIENGWSGIMIDANCDSLEKLPKHPNLFTECVAIDTHEGEANFISLNDPSIFVDSHDVSGMYGLEKSPNPMHCDSYDGERKFTVVKTTRLDSIIKKYHLTEIDFLKIDVEGHEVPILQDYSFVIKPKMIKFEHIHYSGKVYDCSVIGFDQEGYTKNYYNFLDKLQEMGYVVWEEESDVYCVL